MLDALNICLKELLFCQPRVEVTSCYVYKVMGLIFHDRINTQLIYRFQLAQVVARRISEPQRFFFRFESHWLLFFIQFFFIFPEGGLVLLFSSCLIFFFLFISEFTVVCVVTDVLYMCLIHVKGIKKKKKNKDK